MGNIISWMVDNRAMVFLGGATLAMLGWWSLSTTPIDAIPDLSDVQVILYSEYPGQSPDVVEDQVTYPLTTSMMSVPGAKTVRGYSFFGFSFVYIIFDDGTDLYWARSRVLEYLNFVSGLLPTGVSPQLGPDATGVGWVYEYVLKEYGPYAESLRKVLDTDQDGMVTLEEAQAQAAKPLDKEALAALIPMRPGFNHEDAVSFTFLDFDADKDERISAEELVEAAAYEGVDLARLRSLQDWYLRYALTGVEGVAEVAVVGGFVKQYQVEVDPDRLAAYGISIGHLRKAIKRSNNDVGGRLLEMSETEYMVRGKGYLKGIPDLESIPLGVDDNHTPILLRDVATVSVGPELRRGITDWNGQGDVVTGIVIMRFGENALATIERVKEKLASLQLGLPQGVHIAMGYDRSDLIERAVKNLEHKLAEELFVVVLVCFLFLGHLRSSLVVLFTLPLAVLAAFSVMRVQGINANIMSLGGIAIAIGAMVDASIVMIENMHKHLETAGPNPNHFKVAIEASREVGPALFFSLLVITVGFLPVFALQAQEGRLFKPLAFTKTYAMGAAAVLSITLVPPLMGLFIRGNIKPESENPISRFLIRVYRPVIDKALHHRRTVLAASLFLLVGAFFPASQLGSEFMPPLNEGDLLYMPTTLPGVSITKARELLQQTDRIIASFPEVHHVLGKVGRAETATDPAPLSMIETTIVLERDPARWRKVRVERFYSSWPEIVQKPFHWLWPDKRTITMEELANKLNEAVDIAGVTNAWTMPIKTRIDMLATGIKTPVGIKLLGPDLEILSEFGKDIEAALKPIEGTRSVISERVTGGYFLDFDIDRGEAARYGLTVGDVQDVISSAIGGMNVTWTVEGLERFPVNVRYPRELRDNLPLLRRVLVPTPMGHKVPLGQLARLKIRRGPPVIKSENTQPTAWIYVDLKDIDVGTYVERAMAVVNQMDRPDGVDIIWSGQYEYMERARSRLLKVVPLALGLIFLLLYMNFGNIRNPLIVMLSVPFALVGGVWFMWLLNYDNSVATGVGFIALAGVAAETGIVMIVYLDLAWDAVVKKRKEANSLPTLQDLYGAIIHGAVERVRPKMMTVTTTTLGLVPILWSTGTGSQVMKRIAAPMVGGMVSSTILTLVVIPVIFLLVHRPGLADEPVEEQ